MKNLIQELVSYAPVIITKGFIFVLPFGLILEWIGVWDESIYPIIQSFNLFQKCIGLYIIGIPIHFFIWQAGR